MAAGGFTDDIATCCWVVYSTSWLYTAAGRQKVALPLPLTIMLPFLADRTNSRTYATVLRLSVVVVVCDVMYCG